MANTAGIGVLGKRPTQEAMEGCDAFDEPERIGLRYPMLQQATEPASPYGVLARIRDKVGGR